MNEITFKTDIGTFLGNEQVNVVEFLGVPYARAGRFEYCELIDSYEKTVDAREMGNACPQYRQFNPHLDVPERLFYFREFREGIEFKYDEDCLNLNIYAPTKAKNCPVILFFHGGGFNSGANSEEPFRGFELAGRGIITVFANYRVGVLGYFSHEEIKKKYGRNGNFGLDDQLQAIRWVRKHIAEFGGDPDNITLMGQSAGAISIQYLCLNHDNEGLFRRAVMMSGAGLFPKYALPRKAEETYDYWHEMMDIAGCSTFEEFKDLDILKVHDAYETIRSRRKDSVYNMMPVVDGYLIKDDIDKLIKDPLKIEYMIGYTNNDMYAPVMAYIGNRFARDNGGYVYFFDVDQPGDDNAAFHSSDLRYMFSRLDTSWRTFSNGDRKISAILTGYLVSFARNGDPNSKGLPQWDRINKNNKVMCLSHGNIGMGRPSYIKLVRNMVTKGDPKA
ncbi:MAG: carboxylesterase family protein [Erysipelotrichaceae bacterium]|nr:carboxylesterase family protein [Erysipelotrichaceae bacterium]